MIREIKKPPDIDSIIDHIVKTGPPVTERESIASFITDLINLNFIENKKIPNGFDSFYITTELEKNPELDINPANTFIISVSIETSSKDLNNLPKISSLTSIDSPSTNTDIETPVPIHRNNLLERQSQHFAKKIET